MASRPAPPSTASSTLKLSHTESQSSSLESFKVGTRKSLLARVQTDEVVQALRRAWPECRFDVHAMATTGDNNQATALHKFNDKALWTQELEVLLERGELDFIVHSLKDMPTQLPADLSLGCVPARKDARDALVVKPALAGKYRSLASLPAGSVVGTSSLRRIAQLKRHYPHLSYADIRGNIGTRLAKLDSPDSEFAAIIIAVAGLQRLGLTDRISACLSKGNGGMLHAVGQGGLGIEIRKSDTRVEELLEPIACERTTRQALAERSLMRTLEGGCSVPIGLETEWVSKKASLTSNAGSGVGVGIKPAADYHQLTGVAQPTTSASATIADEGMKEPGASQSSSGGSSRELEGADSTDEMVMRAIVVSLDGQDAAEIETRRIVSSRADADEFGWEVAKKLVEKGAHRILESITLNRGIIHEQGDA